MSIKKKIGGAVLATALGASLIGSGTFALFTATASNTSNTFAAGTVKLLLNNETAFSGTINNLAPGDTGEQTFKLKNDGTLQLRYDVAQTLSNGANTLVQGNTTKDLNFVISYQKEGQTTWNTVVPGDNNIVMNPGEVVTYKVVYTLPFAADNDYQGKSSNFQLTFNAEQTAHN